MGRNRLPEEVKSKRGTSRKCRQLPSSTVATMQLLDVVTPSHLRGEAKKIYELKVRQCFAMGTLADIDADALAIYAWELAELIRLQQELKAEGYTYEVMTKLGTETKLNPKEKVVRAKIATVNTIGSQFGWSPVSRMKLQAMAKAEEKKDDFNDLLNG